MFSPKRAYNPVGVVPPIYLVNEANLCPEASPEQRVRVLFELPLPFYGDVFFLHFLGRRLQPVRKTAPGTHILAE